MMSSAGPRDALDYLVVGHVTNDLTPKGPVLGGAVAYAGLTANALGMRTCVATSTGADLDLSPLSKLQVFSLPAKSSTVFENRYQSGRRLQTVHSQAQMIRADAVPEAWRSASIVHLAPVARELDPFMVDALSFSFLGITPQGWMRNWDEHGNVESQTWNDEASLLQSAEATVLSIDDVGGDEDLIASMASRSRVLAVTEGAAGVRVYWRGQRRDFEAPKVKEIDSTGSGDIFAACFFIRLHLMHDPWDAARFANQIAAVSVTRSGLASVPTPEEIDFALVKQSL
jgi:sugar/nucleoside kinase (ribokinase family)